MPEAWFNFTIVILAQLLFFVIHAKYEKKVSEIPIILGLGILFGTVFGLFFDLVFGKFFGVFSYALGFSPLFLILNGGLSYGLFIANTLLMQGARLAYVYLWTLLIITVYEITNHFFPVWAWEFASLPYVAYLIVLSAGYFGLAMLIAGIWHLMLGRRFQFIDAFFKK